MSNKLQNSVSKSWQSRTLRIPGVLPYLSSYTLLPIILLFSWHPVIVCFHTGVKSHKIHNQYFSVSWGLSWRLIFRNIIYMRALLSWNPTMTGEGVLTSVTPVAYLYIFFLFFCFFFLFCFWRKKNMHKVWLWSERSLRNIHLSLGIFFLSESLWWTFPDRIWWGIPGSLLCLPLIFLYQDTARREVATELLRSQNTGSEQALLGCVSHGSRPPSSPFHHSTLRSMMITEKVLCLN